MKIAERNEIKKKLCSRQLIMIPFVILNKIEISRLCWRIVLPVRLFGVPMFRYFTLTLLLFVIVAYFNSAHAFMYQCESVGIAFNEFRVKNINKDRSSPYCEVSAAIRVINCTNESQNIYIKIQGIDSGGFALDYFYLASGLDLDSYSQKEVSDINMLECKILRKITTWRVEVKAY